MFSIKCVICSNSHIFTSMLKWRGVKMWFIYVLYVVAAVAASTEDDIKQAYTDIIIECMVDNPITEADLDVLQKAVMPNNTATKCLFACAYKKSGLMDEKGKLSLEGAQKVTMKYFPNDPDMIKKSDEFTDACKSVNDEAVTDGDKGCERAAMIFKCSVEKAPDFGFV